MTAIYMDSEFLEDGRTIDLISIGLVREDGAELYRINADETVILRAWENPWLRENVLPSLPVATRWLVRSGVPPWDGDHPDMAAVANLEWIAREVRDFILAVPDPQLWADYSAYDHVALCQLWGRMIDLPRGIPMWTHDLRQEAERCGVADLPSMPGVREHNALSDAREVMWRRNWLRENHGGGR